MRAKMHQLQRFSVRLAVNQEQVGVNMAFSMAYPSPDQRMVMISFREDIICSQQADH